MNQAKYIGMDVHQATISVAVMDSAGKLILESIAFQCDFPPVRSALLIKPPCAVLDRARYSTRLWAVKWHGVGDEARPKPFGNEEFNGC